MRHEGRRRRLLPGDRRLSPAVLSGMPRIGNDSSPPISTSEGVNSAVRFAMSASSTCSSTRRTVCPDSLSTAAIHAIPSGGILSKTRCLIRSGYTASMFSPAVLTPSDRVWDQDCSVGEDITQELPITQGAGRKMNLQPGCMP